MHIRRNLYTALVLLTFGIIVGILSSLGTFSEVDKQISEGLQSWQPQWFINISILISSLEFFLVPITLLTSYFLLRNRKNKQALMLLVFMTASFLAGFFLKHIFALPRPSEVSPLFQSSDVFRKFTIGTSTYGFPSAHVFNYTTIFGLNLLALKDLSVNKRLLNILKSAYVLLLLAVGTSRISLGAHYLSQVIAGYIFGFGFIFLLTFVQRQKSNKNVQLSEDRQSH